MDVLALILTLAAMVVFLVVPHAPQHLPARHPMSMRM